MRTVAPRGYRRRGRRHGGGATGAGGEGGDAGASGSITRTPATLQQRRTRRKGARRAPG